MRMPTDFTLGVAGAIMVLTCVVGKTGRLPSFTAPDAATNRPVAVAEASPPAWTLLGTDLAEKAVACDTAQ